MVSDRSGSSRTVSLHLNMDAQDLPVGFTILAELSLQSYCSIRVCGLGLVETLNWKAPLSPSSLPLNLIVKLFRPPADPWRFGSVMGAF